MKIDFKRLLTGLSQAGANTVNAYQGKPMQQFAPVEESENKWWVKDKPPVKLGQAMIGEASEPTRPALSQFMPAVTEPSYGGVDVITKPGLGTPMGTPLINNTDPQTMYRRRGNMTAGNPFSIVGQMLSNIGHGRANGGPVKKGRAYIVGEDGEEILADGRGAQVIGSQGEELIVPDRDGTVIPNPIVKAMIAATQGRQMPDGSASTPVPGFAEEIIDIKATPAEYPNANVAPIQPDSDLAQSLGIGKPNIAEMLAKATQNQANRPSLSPLDQNLGDAERRYQDAVNEDPKALNAGKGGVWKDALIKGLQIFSNVMNPQNQVPIQGWGAQRKQLHVGKAAANLAPLQKLADIKQQRAYRQKQMENIDFDNETQRMLAEERKNARVAKDATTARNNWFKTRPYFDASKATDADKRALAMFGETPESVGTYDFSKRDVKKVGGLSFAYDPIQKKYIDTGLPQAPGEEQAEIEFIDPGTQQKITLKTTSAKKAQMLNSRVVAQMSADASMLRQNDQQAFTAGENEKSRQFTASQNAKKMEFDRDTQTMGVDRARAKLIQDARKDFASSYYKVNKRQPSEQEIQQYVDAVIIPLTIPGTGIISVGSTPLQP